MEENEAATIIGIVEKTEEKSEEKEAVRSYVFVILFYFLGTAAFVPHSFYITANEYWMYKFRDPNLSTNETNDTQKTTLQKNFTANVGIVSNIGMIISVLILLQIHKRVSPHRRIIGTMIALLVLFTLTLIFAFVDTDSWQKQFFTIALVISALLNVATFILLISIFQVASMFPSRCLAAQMAGQNICGILAAVIQIITLGAKSVEITAALYFAIAIGTIAMVMVAYIIVTNKSEEFKNKLKVKPKTGTGVLKEKKKLELATVKKILAKLALLIVSLALNVANSGILHPGLTALVESSGKGTNIWSDTYFLPVCVYFSYNTFEFIGREASNYFEKLKNTKVIFATSVARLMLLPAILFCNIQPRNNLPVIFHDDAYFIIFMILFSISGGYVANVSILVIPKCCEPEERMIGTLFIVLIIITLVPIFSVLSGVVVNII